MWLASPTNGAYLDTISLHRLRLLGSDNSVLESANLSVTKSAPPAGSGSLAGIRYIPLPPSALYDRMCVPSYNL